MDMGDAGLWGIVAQRCVGTLVVVGTNDPLSLSKAWANGRWNPSLGGEVSSLVAGSEAAVTYQGLLDD